VHSHAPACPGECERYLAAQSLGCASNQYDRCIHGSFNFTDNQGVTYLTPSVSDALTAQLSQSIQAAGGWLPFDAYMHAALYTPGLGYYAHGSAKFGLFPARVVDGQPQTGSDFVTAPELSPLFGACLAEQVAQALHASGTHCVYEFGAGTGALALQINELLALSSIGLEHYFIVDVSGSLRARQQEKLAKFGSRVQWLDALPEHMEGIVIGNEVLDAMPVKLLVRAQGVWHERGVALDTSPTPSSAFIWQDRPTALRPPVEIAGSHDYLTEIHPQAEAFIRTIAQQLTRGAAFFIDYGFPESEYYHPQRHMGTLMCHYQHQADTDPLDKVGEKDITAHVNFTGIALAGQDAGLDVLGYCTQARFLMNCGLLQKMELLTPMQRGLAAKLATEHEMGELFKVIGFGKGLDFEPLGFSSGDRSHTL
jgi:SAM-dependent MidA family methyltransferase